MAVNASLVEALEKFMNEELLYFRTPLGEWVMGKLKETDEEGVLLERPRYVVTTPGDSPGKVLTHFVPVDIFNAESELFFSWATISISQKDISEAIVEKYLEAVTDIQIVKTLN